MFSRTTFKNQMFDSFNKDVHRLCLRLEQHLGEEVDMLQLFNQFTLDSIAHVGFFFFLVGVFWAAF
jgi:hypothetical protein